LKEPNLRYSTWIRPRITHSWWIRSWSKMKESLSQLSLDQMRKVNNHQLKKSQLSQSLMKMVFLSQDLKSQSQRFCLSTRSSMRLWESQTCTITTCQDLDLTLQSSSSTNLAFLKKLLTQLSSTTPKCQLLSKSNKSRSKNGKKHNMKRSWQKKRKV